MSILYPFLWDFFDEIRVSKFVRGRFGFVYDMYGDGRGNIMIVHGAPVWRRSSIHGQGERCQQGR